MRPFCLRPIRSCRNRMRQHKKDKTAKDEEGLDIFREFVEGLKIYRSFGD